MVMVRSCCRPSPRNYCSHHLLRERKQNKKKHRLNLHIIEWIAKANDQHIFINHPLLGSRKADTHTSFKKLTVGDRNKPFRNDEDKRDNEAHWPFLLSATPEMDGNPKKWRRKCPNFVQCNDFWPLVKKRTRLSARSCVFSLHECALERTQHAWNFLKELKRQQCGRRLKINGHLFSSLIVSFTNHWTCIQEVKIVVNDCQQNVSIILQFFIENHPKYANFSTRLKTPERGWNNLRIWSKISIEKNSKNAIGLNFSLKLEIKEKK